MSKIYFRTIAYNAEKTLKRCVESVLNQAHGEDIVYYLCDNASTDHTGQMIREYAAQDHRIRAFFNLENHVWTKETEEVLLFPLSIAPEDYFCTLDADDEYFSDFLKVMLPFMQGNQLDIAACGIKMIDQRTSKFTYRQFSEDIVLTHSTFAKYFPSYHAFMRTTWGKLYTGRVTQHMYTLLTLPADILYGGDTLTVFSGLRYARKIGICSKVLHQYFISPKSLSCQYDSRRFTSDVYLYNSDNDYEALSALERCLSPKDQKRICRLDRPQNAAQLKYVISQCEILICSRTHASIAGYSSGVPTLVLGYSIKSAGIGRDLKMEHWVLPLEECNKLPEMAVGLWNKRLQIRNSLIDSMGTYQRQLTTKVFSLA